jgi:toxin YoeB
MGQFRLKIEKQARKDFKKIYKSGNSSMISNLEKIIKELALHPKTGIGNPEQLKYGLSGFWSRRLNKKDRIIYEIIEKPDKMVVVISGLGHYE